MTFLPGRADFYELMIDLAFEFTRFCASQPAARDAQRFAKNRLNLSETQHEHTAQIWFVSDDADASFGSKFLPHISSRAFGHGTLQTNTALVQLDCVIIQ